MKFPAKTKFNIEVTKTQIIKDKRELKKFLEKNYFELHYNKYHHVIEFEGHDLFDIKFTALYDKILKYILIEEDENIEYKNEYGNPGELNYKLNIEILMNILMHYKEENK
jgi:hypothetical protein